MLESEPWGMRPPHKILLRLQRWERAWVKTWLEHPEAVSRSEYQAMRYVLNFAALDRFAPLRDGERRDEITVDPTIMAPFRGQVTHELINVVRSERRLPHRMAAAAATLPRLLPALRDTRRRLLERHRNEFSEVELDTEVTRKTLVWIGGGGGGAGYVYIGAYARLQEAGLVPGYIVGTSIGALMGLFIARDRNSDAESHLAFAQSLDNSDIFALPRVAPQHSPISA